MTGVAPAADVEVLDARRDSGGSWHRMAPMAASPRLRRLAATAFSLAFLVSAAGCAAFAGASSAPSETDPAVLSDPASSGAATSTATADAPATQTVAATATPFTGFLPINVFASPTPAPSRGPSPTDYFFGFDSRRPATTQGVDWLTDKAAGRIALVDGRIVTLAASANPMALPGGRAISDAHTLDTTWSRWIVEPTGSGSDEKGRSYYNLSYWNLCGPGAATVALYYWQQLTGRPNVTGMAGYFVDPYAAEGAAWPSPGPSLPSTSGKRIGTYWSGSDTVNGFTAHGRGFIMYMAMLSQPAAWSATGIAVFAGQSGTPLYPTRGASRQNIQAGLNWEVSGQDSSTWLDAWYASVTRADPNLARDLQAAVTLDVGRDGVPVVVALDTYDLPNWQAGTATPHIRHSVAIVGYDNAANPPTYTYLDTCGRSCNSRGGNQNGQIHVIAQSKMVAAITDKVGSGFVW